MYPAKEKMLTKSTQEFMMRNFQKKKKNGEETKQKIQQIYIVKIYEGMGRRGVAVGSGSYLALSLNDLSTWTCN